jgi:NitT/TauT family transport system substrate-binding protein
MRSLQMKTLVIEHTAPFQGLPELVADAEGLFAREGLIIQWVNTNEGGDRDAHTDVLNPKGLDPFRSHGRLLEQGKADMYNACEWGNYCRVQDTAVRSRQLGRRSIVTFAAIVVPPDSPVYTPQQLADRKVGVPFYFGTHYLALHMLEGFLTREQIVVCSVPHGSRFRLELLRKGEIAATTLTEPYVTLAEKRGFRTVCSAFYHGTQVGTDKIDAETMAAYNRAVSAAVQRIKADKRRYLQYFIDYHKVRDPEIDTLTVDDLRESRLVVCEPAPIPPDEMQRTYEWVKSWGMLERTQSPLQLVDVTVQPRAHAAV